MKYFIRGTIDFEAPHVNDSIKQLAKQLQDVYVVPMIKAGLVSDSYAKPGWQVPSRIRSFTREAYTLETAQTWVAARNKMMKENPSLQHHILTIEIIEADSLEDAVLNKGTSIGRWDTYGNSIL